MLAAALSCSGRINKAFEKRNLSGGLAFTTYLSPGTAGGTHTAASCLTSGQESCCRGAARGQGRRQRGGQGAALRRLDVAAASHVCGLKGAKEMYLRYRFDERSERRTGN